MTQHNHLELIQKYEELKSCFKQYQNDGICIAYSGGVDSTLLLRAAVDAISGTEKNTAAKQADCTEGIPNSMEHTLSEKPVLAVILETQLHPHSDTEQAFERAKEMGADPVVISVNEFQNPKILQNPVNRCYLCKHLLFSSLKELAAAKGYHAIFDGTNKDDETEYRPGMKVLKELGIRSPLLELGITKACVRSISALLGLSTASVPSTPCLATRLPYGTYLDRDLLQRIHQGEAFLREKGFYNVRLRYHNPILRLEINCDEFEKILKLREKIIDKLKELGFIYITLDLEGFRSGSMDVHLMQQHAE